VILDQSELCHDACPNNSLVEPLDPLPAHAFGRVKQIHFNLARYR
jgi:hypothetical protein